MKLGIGERLALQSILPGEGDILTIRIVHDLRMALGLSEEEIKACGVHSEEGNRVGWEKELEKEIDVGPQATALIVTTLQDLNKQKKLNEGYLPIYEKFIGG